MNQNNFEFCKFDCICTENLKNSNPVQFWSYLNVFIVNEFPISFSAKCFYNGFILRRFFRYLDDNAMVTIIKI